MYNQASGSSTGEVPVLDTIEFVDAAAREHSNLVIRLLKTDDSITALTRLLHCAYAPLARRGMLYLASHQDETETRRRAGEGECYLVLDGDTIIATVTLVPPGVPDPDGCAYYQRPGVARFGQFAVDPAQQGRGVGSMLMDHIEARAAELGSTNLALDTSEHAHDLVAMYTKRGYSIVQRINWPVTNYQSVVMSKPLHQQRSR